MATGEKGPFPSIEEAKNFHFTPDALAVIERFGKGAVIGGPEKVRLGLEKIVKATGADELMISSIIPIQTERVASYERLAKVWGLESA